MCLPSTLDNNEVLLYLLQKPDFYRICLLYDVEEISDTISIICLFVCFNIGSICKTNTCCIVFGRSERVIIVLRQLSNFSSICYIFDEMMMMMMMSTLY